MALSTNRKLSNKGEPSLNSLNKEYEGKENRCFAAEVIETKDNFKSPERIVEKIISQPEEYTLENFDTKMEDITRFRIVCNYLSDIFVLMERLKADSGLKSCCKISDEKDYIVKHCTRSHRAVHLILKVPMQDKTRKVELQIMTQLQHAWDKKDHNLIYEKRRIGEKIDEKDKIKMAAMSDLLYVADEFFDDLRKKILKKRNRRNKL
ncbi:MAG: RelA/SpoT domain-containing protein [Candidatus Desantisbacteria bacterium]